MTHKIFISHSTQDGVIADRIHTVLQGRGIACWHPSEVRRSSSPKAQIADAIDQAPIVVLVYTNHTNEARHVPRELELARRTGTLVIPLRISKSDPPRGLGCTLDGAIDARVAPLDPHLDRLAAAIERMLAGPIEEPPAEPPSTKLFVSNLSLGVSEDEIKDAFQAFGTVRAVNIIMDRDTGRPRGFAFVELDGTADAQAAVEALDGHDLGGRELKVGIARPREARKGGGGGAGAPRASGPRRTFRSTRPAAEETAREAAAAPEFAPAECGPEADEAEFEAAEAGPEATESRPEVDDRRLGVDVFLGDHELERAFVADQTNRIVVSIGHSASTPADAPLGGLEFDETGKRELWVSLAFEEPAQWRKIVVRQDPRSEASVDFNVVPTGSTFSATVVLYAEDETTVLQAARLQGAVVADLDAETRNTPTFSLCIVPVRALGAPTPGAGASVVTDGTRAAIQAPGVRLTSSGVTAQELIQAFTNGLATPAGNHAAAGSPIDKTLVAAARFGTRLASDLVGLDQLRPWDRIQVVSLEPNTIFPLELVYDGAAPKKEAKLCGHWKESLAKGECVECASAAPGTDPTMTVCPLHFWGMSKVIEHHVPITPTVGPVFEAREQRPDATASLPRLGRTLVGASNLVLGETLGGSVEPLAAVVDAATKLGDVATAASWKAWETEIRDSGPSVLIAMPHQGRDEEDPFRPAMLEMAGDTESTFGETFVRRQSERPGPVVMLIGCNIAVQDDAIASFACSFRRYAPVVISAIGKVIAREAPEAAAAVLHALDEVSKTSKETVGDALRNARRKLLSESLLVGLQLVGHGDSDWPIEGGA